MAVQKKSVSYALCSSQLSACPQWFLHSCTPQKLHLSHCTYYSISCHITHMYKKAWEIPPEKPSRNPFCKLQVSLQDSPARRQEQKNILSFFLCLRTWEFPFFFFFSWLVFKLIIWKCLGTERNLKMTTSRLPYLSLHSALDGQGWEYFLSSSHSLLRVTGSSPCGLYLWLLDHFPCSQREGMPDQNTFLWLVMYPPWEVRGSTWGNPGRREDDSTGILYRREIIWPTDRILKSTVRDCWGLALICENTYTDSVIPVWAEF